MGGWVGSGVGGEGRNEIIFVIRRRPCDKRSLRTILRLDYGPVIALCTATERPDHVATAGFLNAGSSFRLVFISDTKMSFGSFKTWKGRIEIMDTPL